MTPIFFVRKRHDIRPSNIKSRDDLREGPREAAKKNVSGPATKALVLSGHIYFGKIFLELQIKLFFLIGQAP